MLVPRPTASRSATSWRGSPSRRRSRPTGGVALHRAALAALDAPPDAAPTPRGSPITRRRRATRRRCCAARPRPPSALRRSAPIARRPRSTRGRCVSPTACPATSRPSCSSAARTSAISPSELDEAIEAQERRSSCAERSVTGSREADCLRSLSRLYLVPAAAPPRPPRSAGRRSPSSSGCRRGASWRSRTPTSAHLHTVAEDAEEAIAWSAKRARARRAARRRRGCSRMRSPTSAAVEVLAGAPEAPAKLEQSLALALRERLEDHVGRAYVNLVWWPLRARRYALVDRHLEAGLEYCAERGLDLWRLYLVGCRARSELDRGAGPRPRTPPASRCAIAAPGPCRACSRSRCSAWCGPGAAIPTLAAARRGARAGRADRRAAADRRRSRPRGPRPRGCRRATSAVGEETEAALELALRRQAPWAIGELACWRRRAGHHRGGPAARRRALRAELAGDGGARPSCWRSSAAPTRPRSPSRRRRRARPARRPRRAAARSAPSPRRRSSRAACASAACAGCRAARAPRRERTPPG